MGGLFSREREDEARSEVANLRLQSVASLPHLAVFSDEAHHTYGQSLDQELKKVRKTVDYLAAKTNLICVVNTTGIKIFFAPIQGGSALTAKGDFGSAICLREGEPAWRMHFSLAHELRLWKQATEAAEVILPGVVADRLAFHGLCHLGFKELALSFESLLKRLGLAPKGGLLCRSGASPRTRGNPLRRCGSRERPIVAPGAALLRA